jgi:hypothetical protein
MIYAGILRNSPAEPVGSEWKSLVLGGSNLPFGRRAALFDFFTVRSVLAELDQGTGKLI